MKKDQEITIAAIVSGQYVVSASHRHFTSFADLQAFNNPSSPIRPTEEVYTENARFTDFHDPLRHRGQRAETDKTPEQFLTDILKKDAKDILDILKHVPPKHQKRIDLNNTLTDINDQVTWDEAITKATPGELDEERAEKTKEAADEFVKGFRKNFRDYL